MGDAVVKTIGSNLSFLGGATLIKVNVLPQDQDYLTDDTRYFGDQDLEDLRSIPGVRVVAPSVYSYWPEDLDFQATACGRDFPHVRIAGVDPFFFKLTANLPVQEGRLIDKSDCEQRRQVCVIGGEVREILFEDLKSILGKSVFIQGLAFEVVGLIGEADDEDWGATIFIPITTARSRIPGMYCIKRLTALPQDLHSVEQVHAQITDWFTLKHPLWNRTIAYSPDRLAAIRNVLRIFGLFAYTAIFITLILSGVGTATVMIATVKERIPEIGLKKALGATDWDIVSQFLMESVTVSSFSCATGIILGSLIALILSMFLTESGAEFRMHVLAVLVAIITGSLSGIASGLVPAHFAGELDPVMAMRFE